MKKKTKKRPAKKPVRLRRKPPVAFTVPPMVTGMFEAAAPWGGASTTFSSAYDPPQEDPAEVKRQRDRLRAELADARSELLSAQRERRALILIADYLREHL